MSYGDGIFDSLKRKGYSPAGDKVLRDLGDKQIDRITLSRAPINGLIRKALNVVSSGKLDDFTRNKRGLDQLYHLQMICEIGGRRVVVEKNSTVNVSTHIRHEGDAEFFDIHMRGPLTLREMLDKTKKRMGDEFWQYTYNRLNCQNFIQNLLKANGLWTPQADKWLYQDVSGIDKELGPVAHHVANTATDLGAVFNHVTGSGKPTELERMVDAHLRGGSSASGYVRKLIANKKLKRQRVKNPSAHLETLLNALPAMRKRIVVEEEDEPVVIPRRRKAKGGQEPFFVGLD